MLRLFRASEKLREICNHQLAHFYSPSEIGAGRVSVIK